MKRLTSLFTEHPASVGETYVQHLGSATRFSLAMFGAGLCCLLHGLLPFLFVRTGSSTVTRLYDRMVLNRSRRPLVTGERPARSDSSVTPIGAS